MRILLTLLALLVGSSFFGQTASAGPWAREKGTIFSLVSIEGWTAHDGYPAYYASGFLEYGVTDRISVGASTAQGSFSGIDTELFVGYNVWRKGPHTLSLELGALHNATLSSEGVWEESDGYGVGLAYGRGLSLGETTGWASAELRYNSTDRYEELKLDLTFGVTFANRWKAMGQVFTSQIDDETHIKWAPGLVIPLGEETYIEVGARIPQDDVDLSAMRLGLWQSF